MSPGASNTQKPQSKLRWNTFPVASTHGAPRSGGSLLGFSVRRHEYARDTCEQDQDHGERPSAREEDQGRRSDCVVEKVGHMGSMFRRTTKWNYDLMIGMGNKLLG